MYLVRLTNSNKVRTRKKKKEKNVGGAFKGCFLLCRGKRGLCNELQAHHVSTATERCGGGVSRNRAVPSFSNSKSKPEQAHFKNKAFESILQPTNKHSYNAEVKLSKLSHSALCVGYLWVCSSYRLCFSLNTPRFTDQHIC